jgi:acylphosphatase
MPVGVDAYGFVTDTVVRLEIRGLVQGVGYRWSMAEQARRLGICAWGRNRREGSVEATPAGPREAVNALIAWARGGPGSAAVEAVDVFESHRVFETFEQRPTA